MIKYSSWMAALVLAAVAVPAMAEPDAAPDRYASVSSLNWEIDNGNVAKGSGLRLVYGMPLSEYLAVEVHGGLGGSSGIGGVAFELKQLLGGYLRVQYPFNDIFSIFGRYGYTRAEFDVDDGMTATDETETGGSYGGGFDVQVLSGLLDGQLRLTADYMVYLDKTGGEFVARSVGVRLAF